MKKLLFIGFITMISLSCSTDDAARDQDSHFEILPIESVNMPESFSFNESYVIEYTYLKPSTCHSYSDLFYIAEGHYRTVAVYDSVTEEGNGVVCEPLEGIIETRTFNFHCKQGLGGKYVFQFWQGEDENGNDVYLVHEVPVL